MNAHTHTQTKTKMGKSGYDWSTQELMDQINYKSIKQNVILRATASVRVPDQRDDAGPPHFTARVISIAIPSVFMGKASYLVPSRQLGEYTWYK